MTSNMLSLPFTGLRINNHDFSDLTSEDDKPLVSDEVPMSGTAPAPPAPPPPPISSK